MKTLKKVATLCLVAVLVLAMVAAVQAPKAANYSAARLAGHSSQVLLDEVPTPTPTPGGAGTDSNPAGGDGGG